MRGGQGMERLQYCKRKQKLFMSKEVQNYGSGKKWRGKFRL